VGVHADSRRAEERGPPGGPFDDPAHPQGRRPSTGATAADVVVDIFQAHWGVIAGADFFTTDVWTWRGLVTVAWI
jgi:hypothetical protein